MPIHYMLPMALFVISWQSQVVETRDHAKTTESLEKFIIWPFADKVCQLLGLYAPGAPCTLENFMTHDSV